MKLHRCIRAALLGLAVVGLLIPAPLVHAANPPEKKQQVQILDIVLQRNKSFLGQIVDAQGLPQKDLEVNLLQAGKVVHKTKTDKSGVFCATNLHSGVYQVVSDKTVGTYRLWDSKIAPPSAQQWALLVRGQGPIRGQQGPIAYWLTKPWVIAGLVTTAVVIPVVIHNSHTGSDDVPASN